MIHKRPYIDEDAFKVACKHPRYWNSIHENNAYAEASASGGETYDKAQVEQSSSNGAVSKTYNGAVPEVEPGSSDCSSNLWWLDSHLLFPEFFPPMDHFRDFRQPDEIGTHLDSPSPNLVCIGPENQADILEWKPQCNSGHHLTDEHEERMMGTCVIPMPLSEASWDSSSGRCECRCDDRGSVRCVRQHIRESREHLKRMLGNNVVEELGFSDMGEDVSEKWTEKEEQTFHKVIQTNPKATGRNFWNCLSDIFPCRTKKDLVSYYFNVFMLRKRMEQNRFDSLNIDSDDDEWERVEDTVRGESEDSGVDSLTSQDSAACYQAENCTEHVEDDGDGDVDDIAEGHLKGFVCNCDIDSNYKHMDAQESKYSDDSDDQNGSCTSYENQEAKVDWFLQPDFCFGKRLPGI